MAPIPISSGTCIAFNTGESSTDPEWQAEPVEAATPFNPLKIVEPVFPMKLTSTKLTFNVLGNLSVAWPFNTAGVFVLLSLALGYWVSQYWYLFTAFVGLNLLQSAFTRWCPMTLILQKCGMRSA